MKIVASIITLLSWAYIGNGQPPISFLESNCGYSNGPQYKIIGGETANMLGNPWMALIVSVVSDLFCGGSLITNRFVLTAAHCQSMSPIVYLGEFDRSTVIDCFEKGCMPMAIGIPVDAQIIHPRYDGSKFYVYQNDIALFRLSRAVQYTEFIRPICLPLNFNPWPYNASLTVTGWGKTEYGTGSNVLKITTMTEVDRSHCNGIYGRVDMSHICAGADNSNGCHGDSGGPVTILFSINGEPRVVQVGLVSYGDNRCQKWAVFTNVIYQMNWIKDTVFRFRQ